MKRNIITTMALLFLQAGNICNAVDVATFPEFQAAMGTATEITLLNSLTATAKIANQGQATLTINGGGFSINGNGFGGFSLVANRPLTINNIILENFLDPGNAGVITAGGSSTVTVGDGVQFLNNGGGGNSGVLFTLGAGNTVNFGNDVIFSGNTAGSGGVMFIAGSGNLITVGNGAQFLGNSATGTGAIYNQFGDVSIGDGAVFDANRATGGAVGAISNTGVRFAIGNDATFSNNTATGGAGVITNSTAFSIGDGATFNNNTAGNGSGGAILTSGAGSTFTIGTGAVFDTNTATNGGGGAINSGSTMTIGSAAFSNNTSTGTAGGGAIANSGSLTITTTGTFTGNRATLGAGGAIINTGSITMGDGATFDTNTAAGTGGAISNGGTNSAVNIGTDAQFLNNSTATNSGGAIFSSGTNVTVGIGNGATFSGNSAINGGAITNSGASRITIGNGAAFTGNRSTSTTGSGGGAINSGSGGTLIIGDDATFSGNTASFHGGAIFNLGAGANIEIGNGATFSNNSSTTVGGVIFNNTATGRITIGDNALFTANSATGGSAIYNQGTSTHLNIGNAAEFLNNTGSGAIYTEGIMVIGNTASFTGNSTASFGGAIQNAGTLTIGDGAAFTGNTASSGGAIYQSTAAAAITLGTGATFTGNTATSGGAITNNAGTITINTDSFTTNSATTNGGAIFNGGITIANGNTFTSNSSANGGAIYNNTGGNLTINGGSFTTNTVTNAGGAIFNNAGSTLNLTSTLADITFTGNTAAGVANDIYNNAATININGTANSVVINDGITGTGTINKSNAGSFVLNGSSASFIGTFYQTGGTTLVNGGFLGGVNNITGGILEFANGTVLPTNSVIALGSGGVLNITADTNIILGGNNVTGHSGTYGTINKTGTGTLSINGNSNAFQGVFNQTAGSTIVSAAGKMFGGSNNISNSTLQVTGLPIYYSAHLGDNAILTNLASTINGGTVSFPNISFTGTGATATFTKAATAPGVAQYTLNNKIDNGATNAITFNTTDVKFGSADFTGTTIYTFEDSIMNLTSAALRNYEFTNLNVLNTDIAFSVSFQREGTSFVLDSDTLSVENAGGDATVGINIVKVLNDNENGLLGTHEANVLSGLNFNNVAMIENIATVVYEYTVAVNPADTTSIILDAIQAANENSLFKMNAFDGSRGFNVSFFTGENVLYNIGQSLGTTSEGMFVVQGFDEDPTHGVISGSIVNAAGQLTGERGSFFKLSNVTDLTVANLTIINAFEDGNGSVLNIDNPAAIATLENIFLRNNSSTNFGGAIYNNSGTVVINRDLLDSNTAAVGGAIYNTGAILEIDNSIFSNNSATGDAGAIFNDTGTLSINNARFTSNTSGGSGGAINNNDAAGELMIDVGTFNNNHSTGDGGAIFNAGTTDILGAALFENNSSDGLGGAIFNSGVLTLDSSDGNIAFSGNTAGGIANDIYNNLASSVINFTGTAGTVSLEGGISGTGTINKSNDGTLVLGGDNSNFTGDFNQTGGTTNVTGTFFSGPGDITISDSTLNLGPQAFFNGTNTLSVGNSTINSLNGVIQTNTINNLVINPGVVNFAVDVNAANAVSDRFVIANAITGTGIINLSALNIVGQVPTAQIINFTVFEAPVIESGIVFTTTVTEVQTALFRFIVTSSGGGVFTLTRFGTQINPQAFRGQVATLAAYYNQLIVDNILFDHIQVQSEMLSAYHSDNRYAAILPQFAPYQYAREEGGLWYKAYTTLENLLFTEDIDVRNYNYGSLVGADFAAIKLKDGWRFMPTVYIAYNGGHQTFDDVGMYQNGGQGGFMATFMKENFIGSWLAYGGGYNNEMHVDSTNDRTGNWFAGTAAKLAYNWRLSRRLTFQPTALVGYNIFGKQHWHSDFGAVSMVSGLLNGINIAPGFNLIYNQETWSTYTTFQYMFIANDQINGDIGIVHLPDLRLRHRGFIEYGWGATKRWNDRFLGYFQTTLRNVGRTGISFQAGVSWMF